MGDVELQAFDDFMTTAACSFTVTINDEEKPQIDQSTCPTAVIGTKASPPWPTVQAVDNSGDIVDIKALHRSHDRAGLHVYSFTAEDSSGNVAECSAPIGLW